MVARFTFVSLGLYLYLFLLIVADPFTKQTIHIAQSFDFFLKHFQSSILRFGQISYKVLIIQIFKILLEIIVLLRQLCLGGLLFFHFFGFGVQSILRQHLHLQLVDFNFDHIICLVAFRIDPSENDQLVNIIYHNIDTKYL